MYPETLSLCIIIYSKKIEYNTLQTEFTVEYNLLQNEYNVLQKEVQRNSSEQKSFKSKTLSSGIMYINFRTR